MVHGREFVQTDLGNVAIINEEMARRLEGILFGTSPTDPLVFVLVTMTLAAVAVLASWLPDRRAARVDPLLVLRSE
jgi:putative ABC transport system permease protein